MSAAPTWMLYGAAGHTGTLIAQQAHQGGHQPMLAGRNGTALSALAEKLDMPHRTVGLDDPDALRRRTGRCGPGAQRRWSVPADGGAARRGVPHRRRALP